MDQESVDYFRSRERVEREAANAAATDEARRAHLELAQGYAALAPQGLSDHRGPKEAVTFALTKTSVGRSQ